MASTSETTYLKVLSKEIAISGLFPRVARLRAEHYECIGDPERFLSGVLASQIKADIFTFLQPVSDPIPRHSYHLEWQKVAVLRLQAYEKWWKAQINDKTRNMVRKARKKGVVVTIAEFNDDLLKGICAIYNESPIIQGRRNRHYGKDFQTLKEAHATFLDRSVFFQARFEGELIGFIKMILLENTASIMQINSLMAQRDKAPTNALLAKAVEFCAERQIALMQYGVWSRRSLGAFKKHHGFIMEEVPRYFVPLTWRGRAALRLGLHRNFVEFVPERWLDTLIDWRAEWYTFKYRSCIQTNGAVA
jgi:hypothetical protein